MSEIIEQIGLETFLDYYHKLGLDNKTHIDLQGESLAKTKKYWSKIDLATASFGQGIAITPIQMINAFNSLANQGKLSPLSVVKNKNKQRKQIFQTTTIKTIQDILNYSVKNSAIYHLKTIPASVCAKSGTAQIAIKGTYADDKTIASYIGFSPCKNAKFTMLISIKNPRSSPWGASTSAPVWYKIAEKLDILL